MTQQPSSQAEQIRFFGRSSQLKTLWSQCSNVISGEITNYHLAADRLARFVNSHGGAPIDQVLEKAPAQCKGVDFLPMDRLLNAPEKLAIKSMLSHVVDSGMFTSGPYVAAFEELVAGFTGISHPVLCSSGTDALIIGLLALSIGPGDEVILPSNSFAATENAILAVGAVPVFADIGCDMNLCPDAVRSMIGPKTAAVTAVHMYGKAAPTKKLREICDQFNLSLLEDACQAFGLSAVGCEGDATAISFNPYKNFGVCGKGGCLLIQDAELALRARQFSYHGFALGQKNIKIQRFGLNARLDNIQAAVGVARFPFVALNNFCRLVAARLYIEGLSDLRKQGLIVLPDWEADNSWHLFTIRVNASHRDALTGYLRDNHSVGTDLYYPVLSHLQASFGDDFRDYSRLLARTEAEHSRMIQLPLHNGISTIEIERVIDGIKRFFQSANAALPASC